MKMRVIALAAALGMALFHAPLARSHHSNVAFEVTKVITITGVVKDFQWRNPHTWVTLAVKDANGKTVEWSVEGRAPGVLLRAGWARDSIKPGETITVDMSPAKDGTNTGLIARVTKGDGTILPNAPPPTE
jgi:hypothetical protein